MPRYMETAAEANVVALKLLELIPEENKPLAAEMIARLVNYGVRCSPRGVQHTVRLHAVQRAAMDLPVKVSMVTRINEKTNRSYNALVTIPILDGVAMESIQTTEGQSDD